MQAGTSVSDVAGKTLEKPAICGTEVFRVCQEQWVERNCNNFEVRFVVDFTTRNEDFEVVDEGGSEREPSIVAAMSANAVAALVSHSKLL